MSDYPAGTVAVATVRGVPNVRVIRGHGTFDEYWFADRLIHGSLSHFHDNTVSDVRPLVVLDGTEALHLHDLPKHLRRHDCTICDNLADQIEAQTRPPRPPEPQGLGAVVEDTDGEKWIRVAWPMNPWCKANPVARGRDYALHGTHTTWDHVEAVAVLSKGVQ